MYGLSVTTLPGPERDLALERTQWSVFPSPSHDQNYNYLRAVATSPGGNMWAVGNYGANNTFRRHMRLIQGWGAFRTLLNTHPYSHTRLRNCMGIVSSSAGGRLSDVAVVSANDIGP